MPTPPARSSLFPTGSLSPSSAKTLFAEWYDYCVALLGSIASAAATSGTAPSFVVSTDLSAPLAEGQRMRIKFHSGGTGAGTNTLNRDGTGAKSLKQYSTSGLKIPAVIYAGMLADVEYDGTDYMVLDSIQPADQIFSLTAAANSPTTNNLTVTLAAGTTLQFRSSSLPNGAVSTYNLTSAISLTVPNGTTLGTVNGQAAKLAVIAFNDAGTIRLGITNVAGGTNLDETGLLAFTNVGSANTSLYAGAAYSAAPYRVVGYIDITESVAGAWASQPTAVQGVGGQSGVWQAGYGQSWKTVTRAFGVTYFNTSGRMRKVNIQAQNPTNAAWGTIQPTVNGAVLPQAVAIQNQSQAYLSFDVPPGHSYVVSTGGTTLALTKWMEMD